MRELAPQVLGALIRRYGDFADAEDAVQEALIAAATTWPAEGRPDSPLGWLIKVASRRLANQYRSDDARRRREELAASWSVASPEPPPGRDDTLILMFLCCHPSLTPALAIPLALRAVGGLTTREIAAAFQKSAGPVKPARHVPPYLPISCSGLMTRGSCPMRSATGGSLPALTSSASCGASWNLFGNFAGSVTTSGPSSVPIKALLLLAARAPTAISAPSTPSTMETVIRDRSVRVR